MAPLEVALPYFARRRRACAAGPDKEVAAPHAGSRKRESIRSDSPLRDRASLRPSTRGVNTSPWSATRCFDLIRLMGDTWRYSAPLRRLAFSDWRRSCSMGHRCTPSSGRARRRPRCAFDCYDDHADAASMLFDQHWFRTRGVDHQPKAVLRLVRRHGFHGRIPWRSMHPFRAKWLFSPSCFNRDSEGSSARISGAVRAGSATADKSAAVGQAHVVGVL